MVKSSKRLSKGKENYASIRKIFEICKIPYDK